VWYEADKRRVYLNESCSNVEAAVQPALTPGRAVHDGLQLGGVDGEAVEPTVGWGEVHEAVSVLSVGDVALVECLLEFFAVASVVGAGLEGNGEGGREEFFGSITLDLGKAALLAFELWDAP
jgi:hypothetical protein